MNGKNIVLSGGCLPDRTCAVDLPVHLRVSQVGYIPASIDGGVQDGTHVQPPFTCTIDGDGCIPGL